MSEKIMSQHLQRSAILYVRQSTPHQVSHNQESRRLQYAMRDRLDELGWSEVEVIDEDLGRTASGTAQRTGFERMVARVSLGDVGVVAAREVSRFARNNREWHQLVEICAIVSTLLIDHETVYEPRNSNDRLLLGLKGNLSAYELDQLRQRALAARQAKARRGELLMTLPPGFVKTEDGRMEKDPDRRVQQAIELLFHKTLELGSARQAALWFLERELEIPVRYHDGTGWQTVWRQPASGMIVRMLRNPMYAGAYAYGRRHVVTRIDDGIARRSARCRPQGGYEVLIYDHHDGYVSREAFERLQKMLSNNAQQRGGGSGAPKHGKGLLVGLLRCARCGRKLRVTYTGTPRLVRYVCDRAQMASGVGMCIAFGGTAIDDGVSRELVRVLAPAAIEAAARAAEELGREREDGLEALRLELEAARYEAGRAQRQYDAADPENRLVAGELEARWNRALEKAARLEARLKESSVKKATPGPADPETMRALAQDFARVWHAEQTDIRLKKRIARTLIEEIIVDLSPEGSAVELVIHWKGGVHTCLQVTRRRRGQHGQATSDDTVDAIRVLARVCKDERIAQALNRSGSKTVKGQVWTRSRVKDVRRSYRIPVYDPARQQEEGWLKLGEAAAYVGVTPLTARRYIESGQVEALHPVNRGPWVLRRQDLDRPAVRELFERIRAQRNHPGIPTSSNQTPLFPG
jgi:DNA invertase Pin-like site-specific DNA recombinase